MKLSRLILFSVVVFAGVFAVGEFACRLMQYHQICYDVQSDGFHFSHPIEVRDGLWRHHLSIHDQLEMMRSVPNPTVPGLLDTILSVDRDISEYYTLLNYIPWICEASPERNVSEGIRDKRLVPLVDTILRDSWSGGTRIYTRELLAEFRDTGEDRLNTAIMHYLDHPINSDGFHSIEFERWESQRRKILLIGDSFTYGYSAMPLYRSFADQLLAEGHIVYNAGMAGAGLINYMEAARQLTPRLKPDIVLVVFYHNDIIEAMPDDPDEYNPFYITSSGWLSSVIDGVYYPDSTSWKEALQQCCNNNMIAGWLRWSRLCQAVNTTFINRKNRACLTIGDYTKSPTAPTNTVLREIQKITDAGAAELRVIVLPEIPDGGNTRVYPAHPGLFNGIPTEHPAGFTAKDFRYEFRDPHFSNSGHRKMKDFINALVNDPKK